MIKQTITLNGRTISQAEIPVDVAEANILEAQRGGAEVGMENPFTTVIHLGNGAQIRMEAPVVTFSHEEIVRVAERSG